jgi:hypothetical protein
VASAVEPVGPICIDFDVFDRQVEVSVGVDEPADARFVLFCVLCDGKAYVS